MIHCFWFYILVNCKKLTLLLVSISAVLAEGEDADLGVLEDLAADQTGGDQTGGDQAGGDTPNDNPEDNKNPESTTKTSSTTKTPTTTTTAPDTSCDNCIDVNVDGCEWNPEVIPGSKTDFHYEKHGVCDCPGDATKNQCHVVQRRIRNIPALQAWSASLFLLSICIAGKIYG